MSAERAAEPSSNCLRAHLLIRLFSEEKKVVCGSRQSIGMCFPSTFHSDIQTERIVACVVQAHRKTVKLVKGGQEHFYYSFLWSHFVSVCCPLSHISTRPFFLFSTVWSWWGRRGWCAMRWWSTWWVEHMSVSVFNVYNSLRWEAHVTEKCFFLIIIFYYY